MVFVITVTYFWQQVAEIMQNEFVISVEILNVLKMLPYEIMRFTWPSIPSDYNTWTFFKPKQGDSKPPSPAENTDKIEIQTNQTVLNETIQVIEPPFTNNVEDSSEIDNELLFKLIIGGVIILALLILICCCIKCVRKKK